MTLFSYKLINSQGQLETGTQEAGSEQALLEELQAKDCIILELKETKSSRFFGLQLGAQNSGLPEKSLFLFTNQMATLLESGLALDRSLMILLDISEDNPKLNSVTANILEKVKGGKSLADALEAQGPVFSRFYLNMVRAGEHGGNIGAVLQRLADYLQKAKELRDTVTTALIYPSILLVMSALSLMVMLTFVVPQFKEMFESAGQALPVPTQIVLAVSEFLQGYWWALLLLVLGSIQYFKGQLQDPLSKTKWDRRFLQLPIIGEIILAKETANFSRTFGTLLQNGVSILNSMAIVRETMANKVLIEIVDIAQNDLKSGKPLSDTLVTQPVFPKIAIQMIKMGEETGKLEEMLLRVAVIYDQQLKVSIQRLLALLEPALIITLGLMIAGIIVSILLAILSLNNLAA